MKKQNRILGIVVSFGVACIATTPFLLRTNNLNLSLVWTSIVYNFAFCLLCYALHSFIAGKNKQFRIIKSRCLFACLSIILVGAAMFFYNAMFAYRTGIDIPFPKIPDSRRNYELIYRCFLISSLFSFIVYYFDVLAEKQKTGIEIEQLKQAQLEADLSLLKEQLSPHFLFNTLNTLSSLTEEKQVKDYVSELANVYRYSLQHKEKNTVALQQELAFTKSYLYIVKTRLENAIEVKIDIDDEILQSSIPPQTLQLLIENAIKHNIASVSKRLIIELISKDGYLVVQNNFQPKVSLQASTGTGLSNIAQRYRLLFKKEIIIEKNEKIFTVKLPIV